MDKPRAFVYWEHTDRHRDVGVLYIGRFALPVVVPIILSAFLVVSSAVFGSIWDWITNEGQFGFGGGVMVSTVVSVLAVWILVGAVVGMGAIWRIIADANEWSGR